MTNSDWSKLKKLGEITGIATSALIDRLLQSYLSILTRDLNLENKADQRSIRVMLERIIEVKQTNGDRNTTGSL